MVSKFGYREVLGSVWIGGMRTHRNLGEVVDVGVDMVPCATELRICGDDKGQRNVKTV